ncbi:MAG: thioredoxin family protein [Intestinimonas sp.]|nr:thioredoxin family protein [Intestinimonas sp.]
MKEVLLFVLPGCPHCALALKYQQALLEKHPAWHEIPIRVVDETEELEFANAHKYYYVPAYYVDGVKVHEGHAESEDVERVLRLAAGEPL